MLLIGVILHHALPMAIFIYRNEKTVEYRIFFGLWHCLHRRVAEIYLKYFNAKCITQIAHTIRTGCFGKFLMVIR